MRIIHVMDHSVPKVSGYTIRAKYLLEAQAASGHDVTVLTSPTQGQDATATQVEGVSYHRTQYTKLEMQMVRYGAKHLVFGRAISRGLSTILAQEPFDVVHAHTPFTVARVAYAQARRHGLPFVYEKRNLWEESARTRGKVSGRWPFFQISRAIDQWVTTRADAVCTITNALKTHTIKLGAEPDRIFVVGNGVDIHKFSPRPAPSSLREKCTQGGNFVIGFVGSFFTFEGLPLLLEAFSRLRHNYSGARLVLVGDGEDRARVSQRIVELQLENHVWLVGSVPHDQVLDFYASIDVLVYPRYRSALTEMISPLKPLEPMAMARCVVASDVRGISELVTDNDTGLLFQADSCDALYAKLELLMNGHIDAVTLGKNAREHVIAKRQWQHMAEVYIDAYRRAGVAQSK